MEESFDSFNGSILREALLINNDLGKHSVTCSFSTRLSGRFYQNCSLERHSMRRSRLSEMQAKRRRLERELMLEKRRVKLLGERLVDVENARERALDTLFVMKRGVLGFQSLVRRRQAMQLLESIKYRVCMKQKIALFCQVRYYGWRDRLRVASIRQYLRQQLLNKCATLIQTRIRCYLQRKLYVAMLLERKILRDRSATCIQKVARGHIMKSWYRQEKARRHEATLNVQRTFRGMLGRLVAKRRRQELEDARLRAEAEKSKRIPLHMRRYSSYSVNPNANVASSSSSHQRSNKRQLPSKRKSLLVRRRASIDLTKTSRSAFYSSEKDENDSTSSTITSLTSDVRNERQVGYRGGGDCRKKAPCQPPRRVLTGTTAKSRRATCSGGLPGGFIVTRTPTKERRKSVRTYAEGDITKDNDGEVMVMDLKRNVPSSQSPSQSPSSLQPSEQKISITDEACSIAKDVNELAPQKEETKHNVADIKEVLAESLITYNIKMALDAKNKSSDCGENDDDLAFLLDKSIT